MAFGSPGALPYPEDLAREARAMAREGKPMVVLYSQSGCAWCDEARSHLVPMASSPQSGQDALFRQIDLDSDRVLTDFDGRPTTHRRFARSENIRFTPVLVIYGPGGQRPVEPIVGMRLPDFYGQYVEQAIALARDRLYPE